MPGTSEYLLAPILPRTGQLLCVLNLDYAALPRVNVVKWERITKQIIDLVRCKWGMNTIVLDIVNTISGLPCAVLEVRNDSCRYNKQGLYPTDIDHITEELLDAETRKSLESIRNGEITQRGPFSRVGWVDEAASWIVASLGQSTRTINCDIDQFNASGHFAFVRFSETRGTSVWLKAVGVPNEHEFEVTLALSECVGDYLPTVIAMRRDWNAWLMEDAGHDIDPSDDQQVESAIHNLARLQRASIPHIGRFRTAGCSEQNLRVLNGSVPQIINYLDEAMSLQTSHKVAPLSSRRLFEIGAILQAACDRMETLGIPDTLIHNDINPGNILVDGERCLFTDWSEGHIGNPFLTFQQLRVQVFRDDPKGTRAGYCEQLYRLHWRDLLCDSDIDRAFAMVPALAVLSYLYGRGNWLNSSGRRDPESQSYSRSLARHLDRAVNDPALLRSI